MKAAAKRSLNVGQDLICGHNPARASSGAGALVLRNRIGAVVDWDGLRGLLGDHRPDDVG